MPRLLKWDRCRGRNGADSPLSLPDDQAVEVLNMDFFKGMLGGRRPGSALVSMAGGTLITGPVNSLIRWVPGAREDLAEMWVIDAASPPLVKRVAGGSSIFSNVTLDDAIATRAMDVVGVGLNGKLYLPYDSTVDRMHVYDPSLASPRVRRMGIDPGATAPTRADQGAGAYAATARYYRNRFTQIVSGVLVRRSEPTPSAAVFTPSGAGASARVTRPTAPGEGETHWEVEGSQDGVTFFQIAGFETGNSIAIATTTYDDTMLVGSYSAQRVSEIAGTYALMPSAKYAITDGNRLLAAGAWETGGKHSRVWFTPVLGASDKGDDERVPNTLSQKNWVDLNENDGGIITGLGGPVFGVPHAFKYAQLWKLLPTGNVTAPYEPRLITSEVGSIGHKSICVGRDQAGAPALYFLGAEGPYRFGAGGLHYLGRDVEDIWATVNLNATNVVAHAQYWPTRHQVWFWVATGSSNDPDTILVFDTLLGRVVDVGMVRYGWSKYTGSLAAARCSLLYSVALGTISRARVPWAGSTSTASGGKLYQVDITAGADSTDGYQGLIKSKPIPIAPLGVSVGLGETHLLAQAAATSGIRQTLIRDYGVETRLSEPIYFAAAGSETHVLKKVEGSEMTSAHTIQVQLHDISAASTGPWVLDALALPVREEEAL